jgi:hypothetical protein
MANYNFAKRTALAPAVLAAMFVFTAPLRAVENPKPPKAPRSESAVPRSADQEATKDSMSERDCKKIYRIVHHGPAGKGADALVLDRVECPIARA